MVACLFLSRVLGMVRDTVVASKFGISLDNDSYRLATQIPDLIFMLIAGGGLSSAFIPVFSDLWVTNRRNDAWKVFSVVVTLCSIIAVVLITGAWIFATPIVTYFAEGKDPRVIAPAVEMSRILLPAQFAFLIGSLLLATLYARKSFLAPGLAPNIYNVGLILGALFLPAVLHNGIISVAWGALAGAVIGNMVLPIGSMAALGSRFKPSLDFRQPGVDKFFKLVLPVIFGFSLPSMVNLITQKFTSLYGHPGLNAVLATSNNLMQAPLGIFGQALALAAFPVLAEFVATKRMDLYRSQISKTLRTVLYLGIPSGALMLAFAPQIIDVLYGYGKARNNPENLNAMTDCLRIYSAAIFVWCMQPVLMRGFFSLHKTLKPLAISTGMTGVFIALCYFAHRSSPDFRMLPVATDVAATLLAITLYFALEADVGKLDRGGIIATILLAGGAGAVVAALGYGMTLIPHGQSKILMILSLLFEVCVCSWVYYYLTKLMRLPETEYVGRSMEKFSRKIRR
jgi:putative peptidoglycan lipid II flippase